MTQSNSPSERQNLRQLFDAAVDLDRSERGMFLDSVGPRGTPLRDDLEELLAAHEATDTWLDPVSDAFEGRQIGPYRLIRRAGEGGMGSVYVAERNIGRHVQQLALKIVHPGLSTDGQILSRFEREREILASLDHPNIARFLDIGSTEEGVPYLIMEYVDGQPIDVYCDNHGLSVVARLGLFRMACDAVQYAHTKGVVHRDLKPANMLVTADGDLKLLDFGIARVLDPGDEALRTRSGTMLMTVEYASPEQIRGERAGPLSDVYSLAVVLFELLTGARPYRVESPVPHLIARAIVEEQPIAPRELKPQLAGDLDSIILKALRKEPEWRYTTPAELARDLERHAAGERVLARDDTMRYRAERLVRRILYPSDGVFHSHGMLMLSAGLLGIVLLAERQTIQWGWKAQARTDLDAAAVGVWLCWALWEGRRMSRAGKFSQLDRQSWIVFSVITVALGLLTVLSEITAVIPTAVMAVFWNAGLAMGLLIVGIQANRVITAGGVALLASAIAANLQADWLYAWLVAGMLAGMVIPGSILIVSPGMPRPPSGGRIE